MNASERKKIENSTALLQEVLGQKGSGSGQVIAVPIPGFDEEVNAFSSAARNLEKEIQELTSFLNEAIGLMRAILNYSGSSKQFNEQEKKVLQEPFMALHSKCENIEKSKDFVYHARAIKELLSATYWVFAVHFA